MKYIVYCTTNNVNNKIYVGVHGTEDPDIFDGYIGCGVNINRRKSWELSKEPFPRAVAKYGPESFTRRIIKIFDTQEEALELESEIVNDEFIKREDTYNIALGGGMPPILNKVIYQYTLEGDFVKEWFSIHEAATSLNISETSIGKAVLYKRTSADFLWSDTKVNKLNVSDYSVYSPKIPIYSYDQNGELYEVFESMNDCIRKYNCCITQIHRAIKLGTLFHGVNLSDKLLSEYIKPKTEKLSGEVHQYDTNGIYIQSFKSIKDAEQALNMKLQGINEAIKINNSYYKGFLWARGNKPESLPAHIENTKKIGQYTMDGELVKIYNTLRECRKDFPNVSKVLNGSAKHCHHFTFKYIK